MKRIQYWKQVLLVYHNNLHKGVNYDTLAGFHANELSLHLNLTRYPELIRVLQGEFEWLKYDKAPILILAWLNKIAIELSKNSTLLPDEINRVDFKPLREAIKWFALSLNAGFCESDFESLLVGRMMDTELSKLKETSNKIFTTETYLPSAVRGLAAKALLLTIDFERTKSIAFVTEPLFRLKLNQIISDINSGNKSVLENSTTIYRSIFIDLVSDEYGIQRPKNTFP